MLPITIAGQTAVVEVQDLTIGSEVYVAPDPSPSLVQSALESVADQVISLCQLGGTWTSGPGTGGTILSVDYSGYNPNPYLDGVTQASLARPATTGDSIMATTLASFIAAQQSDGSILEVITPDLAPVTSTWRISAWNTATNATGLTWAHWKLTNTLDLYTTYKTQLAAAYNSVPKDSSGNWVSSIAGGYNIRTPWQWEDSCIVTGFCSGSVPLYRGMLWMAEMAQAAGDIDIWTPQLSGIKSAILSNLWDDSRKLLWGSTELGGKWNDGTDQSGASGLHNVPMTALAILCGIITGDEKASAIDAIRSGLVGGAEYIAGRGHERNGFIRYYPLMEKQHSWRPGETDAYGSGDWNYINGNWQVFAGWVAMAIQSVYPDVCNALLARLAAFQNGNPQAGCPEECNALTGSTAAGGVGNATAFLSDVMPVAFYLGRF